MGNIVSKSDVKTLKTKFLKNLYAEAIRKGFSS